MVEGKPKSNNERLENRGPIHQKPLWSYNYIVYVWKVVIPGGDENESGVERPEHASRAILSSAQIPVWMDWTTELFITILKFRILKQQIQNEKTPWWHH